MLTAANPAIEHGGLVGESKWELDALLRRGVAELLPATLLLPRSEPAADRIARAEAFVRERGLGYPVVLKPDVGHRGLGVLVAREPAALRARLERTQIDLLLQEYIGGTEYGVSYARRPGARGRVTSICPKIPVVIEGDGRSTLERLILDHPRAVCMAPVFLRRFQGRLSEVLARGQALPLGEIRAHSQGTVFHDGRALWTEALERAIDRVGQQTPGLCFGRFDVRAADDAALSAGRFRIIEFNGVTGEPGHIFGLGLVAAWRTMADHWAEAYAIGAENIRRGARPSRLADVLRDVARHRGHAQQLRREME